MSSRVGELSTIISRSESLASKTSSQVASDIEFIDANQLCGPIADRWNMLRCQNDELSSPYFDVEFTKAVARIRKGVKIAVVRDEIGQIRSIFPYQRNGSHGEPVGGRLNDVHGVIGNGGNPAELIKRVMQTSRLSSFSFHSSIMDHPDMKKYVFRQSDSYFIDMRSGWQEYENWYRGNSSTLRRQGQKNRALSRSVGPLRFEFDCDTADVMERLIELKRNKYQRTKPFDILSVQWASDLLREISPFNRRILRVCYQCCTLATNWWQAILE